MSATRCTYEWVVNEEGREKQGNLCSCSLLLTPLMIFLFFFLHFLLFFLFKITSFLFIPVLISDCYNFTPNVFLLISSPPSSANPLVLNSFLSLRQVLLRILHSLLFDLLILSFLFLSFSLSRLFSISSDAHPLTSWTKEEQEQQQAL